MISRYASTFDGFFRGFIDSPGFTEMMAQDRETGQHRNPSSDPAFFTTAFFHDTADITSEIADSGLRLRDLLPIEGPLHWAPGIQNRLSDPVQRELILDTLTAMEHDPAIVGATAHLLAVGQHPETP